jgi:hypothetical protein
MVIRGGRVFFILNLSSTRKVLDKMNDFILNLSSTGKVLDKKCDI